MGGLTRRGFLQTLGGTLAAGGLAACSAKKEDEKKPGEAPKTNLTGAEAEAARAEIRTAIGLLFDRNYIVESITQNGERPANTFVCPGVPEPDGSDFATNAGQGGGAGYYDVKRKAFKTNTDAAMKTLQKYYTWDPATATFLDVPELTYVYDTSAQNQSIAEYIQVVLSQIGITLNLEQQPRNDFLNIRKQGGYALARNGWVMDYADPICMLDMWTSQSGNNDVQFGKAEHESVLAYDLDLTSFGLEERVQEGSWAQTYDNLVGIIDRTPDQAQRFALMHVAEDLLMSTGCLCPLYYYTMPYLVAKGTEGHVCSPQGHHFFRGVRFGGSDESYNVCIAPEPETLDPALISAVDDATIAMHLFAGLARWVKRGENDWQVEPDCAVELPAGVQNEDGTVTYTYVLRDGLTWSDGKPLTAHDFAFAWNRAASSDLGSDYRELFSVVSGFGGDLSATAVDDKTLQVVTTNPVAYWNQLLAFPTFFPVREDVVANGAWAREAGTYVCNGAYRMEAWDHGSVLRLQKNDAYWDAAGTVMRQLNFFLSDDEASNLAHYESGEWQFVTDIPASEIARMRESRPEEYLVAPCSGTYYLCWNVNEDILPV